MSCSLPQAPARGHNRARRPPLSIRTSPMRRRPVPHRSPRPLGRAGYFGNNPLSVRTRPALGEESAMFAFARPASLLDVLALGVGLALAAHPVMADPNEGDDDMEELMTGLKPADPQPDAAALKPGLAVRYHMGRFNNLHEMMGIVGNAAGDKGKPLTTLDYQGPEGATVLTSPRRDMVGALIDGFIKFPQPGTYVLKVMSNDGISLDIGGRNIFEDGSVHPTDYSWGLP